MKRYWLWLICCLICVFNGISCLAVLGIIDFKPLSIIAVNVEWLKALRYWWSRTTYIVSFILAGFELVEFMLSMRSPEKGLNVDYTFIILAIISMIMSII